MVQGRHMEQPDTMKGKGSSISTAKLDYFSRISTNFRSYCWVKGSSLTEQVFWSWLRLVTIAESQAKWDPGMFFLFHFLFFFFASLSCYS